VAGTLLLGFSDPRNLERQRCAVGPGRHTIQPEGAARTGEGVRGRTAGHEARSEESSSRQIAAQERITASFARFSAIALDLEHEAVQLLIDDFLPAGTRLARWARRFDARLSMDDIIQACRNAWTACGLQPLLGERVRITPSILGYNLLYPYSDNYLDRADISAQAKLRFSERFRARLRGERLFSRG
jgi:hypothetical protein